VWDNSAEKNQEQQENRVEKGPPMPPRPRTGRRREQKAVCWCSVCQGRCTIQVRAIVEHQERDSQHAMAQFRLLASRPSLLSGFAIPVIRPSMQSRLDFPVQPDDVLLDVPAGRQQVQDAAFEVVLLVCNQIHYVSLLISNIFVLISIYMLPILIIVNQRVYSFACRTQWNRPRTRRLIICRLKK
jgi:hypothetical protein